MKMKNFEEFVNEEFNLFGSKKNQDILDKIKGSGLKLKKVKKENGFDVYLTQPKNGYEFSVSSGSDGYIVETSYNGTLYNNTIVNSEDLMKHFNKMMSEKPNTTHKFSNTDENTTEYIKSVDDNKNVQIIPKPTYTQVEIDRFKRTVEEMEKRNQRTRKQKLTDTFFNEFIGLSLLDSVIEKFDSDFDTSESSNYSSITIYLENGQEINYTFNKNNVDMFKIKVNKQKLMNQIRGEFSSNYTEREFDVKFNKRMEELNKLSRTDIRTLSKIAKTINPNTKYKTGTKAFHDEGFIVKEYESKKYKF